MDVFFVLSGFLITSIILRDIHEGTFSLKEFYLRRIQRLLPNFLATLITVLILSTIFLHSRTAVQTGVHALYTLCLVSNIYIWRNLDGYWGDAAERAPLTHTWSLAIEEQFYVLFPVALVLLVRFQRKRLAYLLAIATGLSFGLCLLATPFDALARFYLLPTRAWEMLLGAVVATFRGLNQDQPGNLNSSSPSYRQEFISIVGLAMILDGFFFINKNYPFPGFVSLIPTLGTALLLLTVVHSDTLVSQLLSSSWFVMIGRASYSLYLWHWPLITIGKFQADRYGFPQISGAITGGLISILLSCSAYFYIEKPLRERGTGRSRRLATIAAGYAMAIMLALIVSSRTPIADPENRFDKLAFQGGLYCAGTIPAGGTSVSVPYYDIYLPARDPRTNNCWREGGVTRLYGGGKPKIVVLGSSHALMYSRVIDDICRDLGVSVAFLGVDGGTPAFFEAKPNANFSTPHEAAEFDDTRRRLLREWHPDAVFVIDRWDFATLDPQVFGEKLRAFSAELSPLTTRILWVSQVPVISIGDRDNLREVVNLRMKNQPELPRLMPDSKDDLRRRILAMAESIAPDFPNMRILRAHSHFYLPDGSVKYASGRHFYYADDDHLSESGTEVVRELFEQAILEARTAAKPK